MNWLEDQNTVIGIAIGLAIGIITRMVLLRTDYRQYPTYPHGRIIHLSLGVIAAGLGAVAVPAFIDKDFTAITFLSLAAQQFREVRNMERETLSKLDEMELVPRGASYIEGIAMVFEGRNYLVIFSSLMTTCISVLSAWYWGVLFGIAALVTGIMLRSGKTLKDVADIEIAEVIQDGPNLYVGDIYIMNVGLKASQEMIAKQGIGLIAVPKNKNARAILGNLGQRQALLHDLSTILGVCRDSGEPSLLPLSKLDISDGRLGIFLLPQERDVHKARKVTLDVPLLESAVKMPTDVKV
ncbi:YIEGIA family protein [Paenibacillus senegalensis]|uniref:YIEGIA family protein n=1 Tax=Paenibacillus senegalensis TaxID=1465766 RepID=UPI00028990F7|nr:YIEGIA family protein [Paenibacillus senegalensis]